MPQFDMDCMDCGHRDVYLIRNEEEKTTEECKGCGKPGHLQLRLSTFASYSIKGNNSASVTPKKFRGGRRG